jgi:alkylhydroperoxidase family enzyme
VDEEDIAALRAQGLSDADISDAIQVVGYFNYVTRVADGVGVEDEPEWSSA